MFLRGDLLILLPPAVSVIGAVALVLPAAKESFTSSRSLLGGGDPDYLRGDALPLAYYLESFFIRFMFSIALSTFPRRFA